MRRLGIHDVGVGVSVDDDHFGPTLAVDFHAGERIPARELHLRRIAEHAFGVNHVDQPARVVRADQRQQRERQQGGVSAQPGGISAQIVAAAAMAAPATQNDVRPSDPIQQRDDCQASQRSATQVGAVESRDPAGLARENDCEKKSGEKEGNGGSQVERRQPSEVCPGNLQRDRNVQNDLQHTNDDYRIRHAQSRGERARVDAPRACVFRRYAHTPPAPRPSRAIEIARKAK